MKKTPFNKKLKRGVCLGLLLLVWFGLNYSRGPSAPARHDAPPPPAPLPGAVPIPTAAPALSPVTAWPASFSEARPPAPPAAELVPVGSGNDSALAAALQPDGKLVVAGSTFNGRDNDCALVRFNTDGSLDAGFGAKGRAVLPLGAGNDVIRSIAIQADGRIVAAGTTYGAGGAAIVLARFRADGELDAGFGVGGIVTAESGPAAESLNAVALQADGKIVAAGYSGAGANGDFLVVRYLDNGTPDPGFGADGKVFVDFHAFADAAFALALQLDGKIAVAGEASARKASGLDSDFAIARLLGDGRLDPGFGSGGKTVIAVTPLDDRVTALALDPGGGMIAAGYAGYGNGADLAFIRLRADGGLDAAFGEAGLALVSLGPRDDVLRALALRPDGRIVAAGSTGDGERSRVVAAVRLRNGAPDERFGVHGIMTAAAGTADAFGYGLALPRDGSIVVAGTAFNGNDQDFVLMHFADPGAI